MQRTENERRTRALNKEAIAKKMRELRGNRTQEEVSKAIRISGSALSAYETGERIPRDEVKLRIARYYNESVENIFFATE